MAVARNNAAESDRQPKKTKVKISSNVKQEKGEEKKHFTFYFLPFTWNGVRKKDLFLTSREKLLRAYGGCLGAECRRRTWDTAKSPGEL